MTDMAGTTVFLRRDYLIIMRIISKPIVLLLCLTLVVTLSLAACGSKNSGDKSGDDGDVLAVVGDTQIKSGAVDRVSTFLMYMNEGEDYNTLEDEATKTEWRDEVLVYLFVETEILKNYFKEKNADPMTDEVKEQITANIDETLESEDDLEATLKAMGVERADIEFYFEADAYYEAYSEDIIAQDPATDEEISTYYEDYKDEFVSEDDPEQQLPLEEVRDEIAAEIESEHVETALEVLREKTTVDYKVDVSAALAYDEAEEEDYEEYYEDEDGDDEYIIEEDGEDGDDGEEIVIE
jgi:hypothetical protein